MPGLRPVNIQQDLTAIADLVEVCFADTLDSSGRAAIQEMRVFARLGPLLALLTIMDRMLKGLVQGFVWEDDGAIIGNVSLYPAGYNHTWIIANVAVHPNYREQGIARQLCRAALERITERGGQAVVLQVDYDNHAAIHLYETLGFRIERAFTQWKWRANQRPPRTLQTMPHITYLSRHHQRAAYDLIQQVRPNHQGGLGWLRPLTPQQIRPGWWQTLRAAFSPVRQQTWVAINADKQPEAVIMTKSEFGATTLRFDLMVHPHQQGLLEDALVNYILRQTSRDLRGAYTEHPHDDHITAGILKKYGFEAKRTLIHMRWQV